MIATESRPYTMADFEEIRPGVFQLRGHHLYASAEEETEACEACGGRGKVPGTSRSGRKVWRGCTWCFGKGRTGALRNVELSVPKTGTCVYSMDRDMEGVIARLNSPVQVSDYLKQPTYIHLYG
jgi:hypothetical protein